MTKISLSKLNLVHFGIGAAGGAGLGVILLIAIWLFLGTGDEPGPVAAVPDAAGTAPAKRVPDEPAKLDSGKSPDNTRDDLLEISTKLKRIALAFHYFHDRERMFAYPRLRDMEAIEPNRKPRPTELSWRVHLLPYLEEQPTYSRFHLDEPWDSPHNLTLIEHMPDIYRIGGEKGTSTRFQVLTGPGMLFGQKKPASMRDVPDGPRHTILVMVVGPKIAVPWTKPDDVVFDPKQPLASIGAVPGRYVPSATVDGQLLMIPKNIDDSKFLALATPKGNEIIDADTYRREYDESKWDVVPSLLRRLTTP